MGFKSMLPSIVRGNKKTRKTFSDSRGEDKQTSSRPGASVLTDDEDSSTDSCPSSVSPHKENKPRIVRNCRPEGLEDVPMSAFIDTLNKRGQMLNNADNLSDAMRLCAHF